MARVPGDILTHSIPADDFVLAQSTKVTEAEVGLIINPGVVWNKYLEWMIFADGNAAPGITLYSGLATNLNMINRSAGTTYAFATRKNLITMLSLRSESVADCVVKRSDPNHAALGKLLTLFLFSFQMY